MALLSLGSQGGDLAQYGKLLLEVGVGVCCEVCVLRVMGVMMHWLGQIVFAVIPYLAMSVIRKEKQQLL